MLLLLATSLALAGTVTLHVGVHRDAGSEYDIAADGAAGQCVVVPTRISCPALGPVHFRWGPGGVTWSLQGDTVLEPGQTGTAWVLAPEGAHEAERASLRGDELDRDALRTLWVRTGSNQPPVPSLGMLQEVLALGWHPDPEVRLTVLDGLQLWVRHTAADPMPPDAPSLLPVGFLAAMASDRDERVRVRVVRVLRDLDEPVHAEEAGALLSELSRDRNKRVRRVAHAALSSAAWNEQLPPVETWQRALAAVPESEARGRAACGSLARLAKVLEPSDEVDPAEAIELVLHHHPERTWRVWAAWRKQVPFQRAWADVLLRETLGLRKDLLVHWSQESPGELAEALKAWEPAEPHSQRWEIIRSWLVGAEDPALREVLGLA